MQYISHAEYKWRMLTNQLVHPQKEQKARGGAPLLESRVSS